MKSIYFQVTDEDYERMTHEPAYIDVFGTLRWMKDAESLKVGVFAVRITVLGRADP